MKGTDRRIESTIVMTVGFPFWDKKPIVPIITQKNSENNDAISHFTENIVLFAEI